MSIYVYISWSVVSRLSSLVSLKINDVLIYDFKRISVKMDYACLKIGPNKPGLLPDHSQTLLGIFRTTHFPTKTTIWVD